MKLKYSIKFIWGAILIVLSFIIGGVTKVIFFWYLNNKLIAGSMVALYFASWPMLILGAWWVGKEYAESIKRYFRYKYYHKYVAAGAKKVVDTTKVVGAKARERGGQIKNNVKVRINNKRAKLKDRKKAIIIKNS